MKTILIVDDSISIRQVVGMTLKANGFEVEHEAEQDDSEIVIINTCGFIDNAKQESIDTILRYAEAKKEGLVDKLYVTGCLSERYRDSLEKEIKNIQKNNTPLLIEVKLDNGFTMKKKIIF